MTREISLQLSSEIVYVSGIVNEAETVFQFDGEFWKAKVEKSVGDVYNISLAAYDTLGRSQSIERTIYHGTQLITYRTLEDVKRGREKGFYNYHDLNRVENATKRIAELLTENGYITTVSVKTDWVATDFPTQTQMKRYLGNVKKCVDQFCMMPDGKLPISMDKLDYIGANDIESVLRNAEILVGYMLEVLRMSGTFFSGNNEGLRGYSV